jgi:hypothetical protein
MGTTMSSTIFDTREKERLQENYLYNEALRKYYTRIQSYKQKRYNNPSFNMPYWKYEKICRQQFELDCLPDSLKYGPTYCGDF